MGTYVITGPGGKKYRVTGPGSKEEALAQIQKQVGGEAPADNRSYLQQAGDYISGTVKNFADPAQWSKAMENPVITSLQNPQQAVPDLVRTTGDFASFGLTDRLRAGLSDNTYEQEKAATDAASTRLGSLDEAAKMGMAVMAPSMGAKAVPQGAGALTKAAIYGGEGAGLSGVQAVMKGEDPKRAMLLGAAGGAGGSALASGLGKGINYFKGGKPQFKTDEALFAAAENAPRNTIVGKDIHSRANIIDQMRMAETKGQQGFKDLADQIATAGRKTMRVPREVDEGISRLGNLPRKGKTALSGAGDIVQGGTGWGRLPVAVGTVGVAPIAGTAMKVGAELMDPISPKGIEAIKQMLRQGGGAGPAMTPEMVDQLRTVLAKMGASTGRM